MEEIITFTSLIFDSWNGLDSSDIYFEAVNPNYPEDLPEKILLEDRFLNLIDKYHNESDSRIPYQYIANIVYQTDIQNLLNNPEDWDSFTQNLDANCLKSIGKLDSLLESEDVSSSQEKTDHLKEAIIKKKKIINKIISHFELSYIQSQFIKHNTLQALEIASESTKAAKSALAASNEAKNIIENTKGKMYTEFIAILGIFSALMFGLISGYTSLGESFSLLADSNYPLGRVLMGSSAIAIGLISFMYTLIQWIGHLIKNPVRSDDFDSDNIRNKGVSGFEYRHSLFLLVIYILLNIFLIGLIALIASNAGILNDIYLKEFEFSKELFLNYIQSKLFSFIAIAITLFMIAFIDLNLINKRLFVYERKKSKLVKYLKDYFKNKNCSTKKDLQP